MAKKLTPMMQQYMDLKQQYKDCILFFRLGDFYEMFFEDAKTASRELEITLTGRDCGQVDKAPMCGVPHHSAQGYIYKLIKKGYKVAICEQVEDPKQSKGIVKREVVRIITPGTNLNMTTLEASKNNYLMSLYYDQFFGLAIVDITTGEFLITEIQTLDKLMDELTKFNPSEIICNKKALTEDDLTRLFSVKGNSYVTSLDAWYFDLDRAQNKIKEHFKVGSIDGLGLKGLNSALCACGAMLEYLYETQKNQLIHINQMTPYSTKEFMMLDGSSRRNLELVETIRDKQRKGSLLWVLDKTQTAMGARRLRKWVEQPLLDKKAIEKRLDSIEELVHNPILREEFKENLAPVYDLERLISKISTQTANPRDLMSFKQSLGRLPSIEELLQTCQLGALKEIRQNFDILSDLHKMIDKSLLDEPPITIKEGGIIKKGYNEEVDELRKACTEGKLWIADLEAREKSKTGIKSLKIKFNKVFGYYIEVTKSYLHVVPDRYQRKQTLANAERFITPELKEMENTILGAEEKVVELEYTLYLELRNKIAAHVKRVQRTAKQVAYIDVIQSLAFVAQSQNYVRPQLSSKGIIRIEEGRHPVVEKIHEGNTFIPNSTFLDEDSNRFAIITGPNMAGKSTYMRQVALIVLMAQIGSFVPASQAEIGIVDRIFTRVGASDNLASGQSTFMVEMTEVANILRNATKNSLLILDEIGRGTSTYDGLSIAWAVVEYVANHNTIGAKSLFATHYHELTELEGKISGVSNYCIAVKEKGEDIIFLRKIIQGGADKSYGIQVAKLAGVPDQVLNRAREILLELSEADIAKRVKKKLEISQPVQKHVVVQQPVKQSSVQLDLFEKPNDEVIKDLIALNLLEITPLEAMNTLYELQKKVKY